MAIAGKCNYCAKNRWFIENADAVENYMRTGLTYSMAVVKVMFDNRPLCFVCGDKVKGSRWKREDNFCNKQSCKREARYYKYLRIDKNKTRQQALEIISERINARSKQVA